MGGHRDRAWEEEGRRFRIEAETAARLDHPNIVPVYDVGEIDGCPFFTMKYVEGTTLARLLDEHPLPPRAAARLIAAVPRGIHPAHAPEPLHRHLKQAQIRLEWLQKQTALRSPTAAALAEDLERFLRGERPAVWSGTLLDVVGNVLRETHHAPVLENWGLLWLWQSLKIFLLCAVTNWM